MDYQSDLNIKNIAPCPKCGKVFRFRFNAILKCIKQVDKEFEEEYIRERSNGSVSKDLETIIATELVANSRTIPSAELVEAQIEGSVLEKQYQRTTQAVCIHCGAVIMGYFLVSPLMFKTIEDSNVPLSKRGSELSKGMSSEDLELFRYLDETGLMRAFTEALEKGCEMAGSSMPTSIHKYFITYITSFSKLKKRLAEPAFISIVKTFGRGKFEFWAFQQVLTVIQDGKIAGFVPYQMAMKEVRKPPQENPFGEFAPKAKSQDLGDWMRTKHGYVPVSSRVYLDELNKRSPGSFQLS